MDAIPPEDLEVGGTNAPVHSCTLTPDFAASRVEGAARYRHTLEGGRHLDALVVNKSSDVLVVTFHGAVDRAKTDIPRFERLRSMSKFPVSAMYIVDPTLWMDERMQLSWYVGWEGFDAQRVIADWALRAARAVGATRIVFSGASGGGFAALQVSALVPRSLALAFNAQTSIHRYRVNGLPWAQQHLMRVVWPELAPDGVQAVNFDEDWTAQLDDRMSALRRYSQPLENYATFVINRNEDHYEGHYWPWLAAAARGNNLGRIQGIEYDGSKIHNPPTTEVFDRGITGALDRARELPPTITSGTAKSGEAAAPREAGAGLGTAVRRLTRAAYAGIGRRLTLVAR
ncbi:hypothetical protein [Kocuria rhizophila]|uniref:hypothetical protein n=2 Tax=Kocuria rhizophila TaxID=72000 RepID=UPI00119F0C12|nr:hypothetical protein [Kocuria rhizophila]